MDSFSRIFSGTPQSAPPVDALRSALHEHPAAHIGGYVIMFTALALLATLALLDNPPIAQAASFGQQQNYLAARSVPAKDVDPSSLANGDALVATQGRFANEVASTQHQRNEERISIARWLTPAQIADVTSFSKTIDVTAALQKAFDDMGPHAGRISWLPGHYLISEQGALGYCLKISHSIQLIGDDAFHCALVPAPSVRLSCDIILVSPAPSVSMDMLLIENLFIGNPAFPTRPGHHGIHFSTTGANQYISKPQVRGCYIANGSGKAIQHTNAPLLNPQGGMAGASFTNNELRGGIDLTSTGDNNVIRDNIIAGTGHGVRVDLILGASQLTVDDNTIRMDARGAAAKFGYCPRLSFRHNNMELVAGNAGSNGALVDFDASVGPSTNNSGVFEHNLFSILTGASGSIGLRIKAAHGLTIGEGNAFLAPGGQAATGIQIVDGSAVGCKIKPQIYNAAFSPGAYAAGTNYGVGAAVVEAGVTYVNLQAGNIGHPPATSPAFWTPAVIAKIEDNGQGTCGVEKPLALLNSWVACGPPYSQPMVFKDTDGIVHLSGRIKNGTAAGGTALFTLPVGFRPAFNQAMSCFSLGGATAGSGALEVHGTANGGGAVTLILGGNTQFSLDGISFRAEQGADGLSLE